MSKLQAAQAQTQGTDPFSLDRLEDLVLPEAPPWFPPGPFWWLLVAILAVWALAGGWVACRRWREAAHRRAALRELSELERQLRASETADAVLVSLARLIKRVALVSYEREQVASLTGIEWLRFLDEGLAGDSKPLFACAPCDVLGRISSSRSGETPVSSAQAAEVLGAARLWIKAHQVPEVDGDHAASQARGG